ncbi:FemAB family XrtA/PEP-CTERM system-associated protein [Alteraurantiacibacter aquimixticola]|uniref:FemAB family PEP-CTERM system-associated protein n=1 Tax=Alteraurantiacibacter aquimixticola TaxID=2489173 RepID=A0A4V4U8H0_9SPHN|nr:FemAB family XrtA/PEP-CTERM system-associated protein [Alteraurantiacibacter aquimixticola]TIX49963.1 FemAB family PEP-CTERM system-associated protein [Alteraurantiacibacter aquimixticola]
MNAPFALPARMRVADLSQAEEVARIEAFVFGQGGSIFHRPAWLHAVEEGTGNRALGLVAERGGEIAGWLPLTEVHSAIFGRMLASSGFAVGGGALAADPMCSLELCRAAEELAVRRNCTTIELRGGLAPEGWDERTDSHCGFVCELAEDEQAQLLAIPRKQRAEVRKGLQNGLRVSIGTSEADREAHYAIYAESVRNLGTPVFPRALFDAVLDGLDADILTVSHEGRPVASVLSLHHDGAVMPYWGGGTLAARHLRANDVMYFALMNHARIRGCTHFDFGRSKTGSGAFSFKRNWGFEPQPLTYASWTAPGAAKRDADPNSDRHAARIAAWQHLPLGIANCLGPIIARGLG